MESVIEIAGLTKRFGSTVALDGFDMDVQAGDVHAFLGPNGAGKSTTLRVLLGLLRAGSGRVRLLGGDPWRDAVKLHKRLAYVPGDVSLWPTLTGGEAVSLLGRMRGAEAGSKGGDYSRRAHDLAERFELDLTKKGRNYSKGNRQKVALVAALASDVELFLFDEPTSGLDPLMERVFQECVAELRSNGQTVLLSSHILSQIDRLCDTVTIVRDGRAVQHGRLDDLRHLHRLRVTAAFPAATSRNGIESLRAAPGVHGFAESNGRVSFSLDREHLADTLRLMGEAGATELESQTMSLEELFLHEYARNGR